MKLQRWIFLRELIPLALLLVVLDCVVFEKRLFTFEPSPLWLLILLVPPRRGSIAGFACGLAAAALYLWSLSEQGYLWQDLLHRQPALLVNPGLFLLFGVYLGAIGESQTQKIAYFKDQSASLAEQLNASEITRAMLERRYLDMEKLIAGQGTTLLTLQNNLQKLDSATSEEELLLVLDSILREESSAEHCGIWRISQGRPELVAGQFDAIPAIALAVGKNRKMITAAAWSHQYESPPGADLSALVADNESERIVVAFAGTPFVRLTRDFTQRIGLITGQAGVLLRSLRIYELLRQKTILDTDFGLVSEAYLRQRMHEEIALVRRDKMQFSLIACSITSSNKTLQARLEHMFSRLLRAGIRITDGLAWFSESRTFVVLLSQCDEQGAMIVLNRFLASLDILDLRDEHHRAPYELHWNIHECGKDLDEDGIFRILFSGMHNEAGA